MAVNPDKNIVEQSLIARLIGKIKRIVLDINGAVSAEEIRATAAEAAAKTEVVQGENCTIEKTTAADGHDVYTINADGKPQVQSDWSQSDSTKVDYIKNKPNLALKENVSNKSQSIDPTSTTEYGSSKAVADFVNSSVATNTANFLGSFSLSDLSLTYPATDVQIAAALNSHTWPSGVTPTNNDYVYVEIQNPQTTGVDDKVERFKFSDMLESWGYEYTLNNSSFTAAEIAAIDSGITATDKGYYDAHLANTNNPHGVTKSQVGLGNVVNTGDSATPAENGTEKFTTGGAYTELAKKVDKETGKGLSANDFTDTYKNNVDSNTSARHSHSNKSVLDGISSTDVTNWDGKYVKPSGGIPKTDLASDVQTSLGKADSALQAHQSVTDNNPTLSWGTRSKVGSVGGTELHVTMPSNPASGKLDSTGDASNTTATFTKATGDASTMASGGKLSAIFTAISSFFASLKALAFKDKASYNDLSSGVQSSLDKADSALQAHQSVTDNNPTLAWGATSKVGSVGSTDLRVTMPSNPASGKLSTDGDGSNVTASFTAASTRTNISTGEKLSVMFGKIAKWFGDLGTAAFKTLVTSWSNPTSDSNIPSEKLVKDSLDGKQDALPSISGKAGKVLKVNSGATGFEWATDNNPVPIAEANYNLHVLLGSVGADPQVADYLAYYGDNNNGHILMLGDSEASPKFTNNTAHIRMYHGNQKLLRLFASGDGASNDLYFPTGKNGTIALTSDIPSVDQSFSDPTSTNPVSTKAVYQRYFDGKIVAGTTAIRLCRIAADSFSNYRNILKISIDWAVNVYGDTRVNADLIVRFLNNIEPVSVTQEVFDLNDNQYKFGWVANTTDGYVDLFVTYGNSITSVAGRAIISISVSDNNAALDYSVSPASQDTYPTYTNSISLTKSFPRINSNTNIGSTSTPVYVDSNGQVKPCTPSSMSVGSATSATNVNLSKIADSTIGDTIKAGNGSSVIVENAGNAYRWGGYRLSFGTFSIQDNTICIV